MSVQGRFWPRSRPLTKIQSHVLTPRQLVANTKGERSPSVDIVRLSKTRLRLVYCKTGIIQILKKEGDYLVFHQSIF